jgi:hypothetical protein
MMDHGQNMEEFLSTMMRKSKRELSPHNPHKITLLKFKSKKENYIAGN